jgi:hypothetical protein
LGILRRCNRPGRGLWSPRLQMVFPHQRQELMLGSALAYSGNDHGIAPPVDVPLAAHRSPSRPQAVHAARRRQRCRWMAMQLANSNLNMVLPEAVNHFSSVESAPMIPRSERLRRSSDFGRRMIQKWEDGEPAANYSGELVKLISSPLDFYREHEVSQVCHDGRLSTWQLLWTMVAPGAAWVGFDTNTKGISTLDWYSTMLHGKN